MALFAGIGPPRKASGGALTVRHWAYLLQVDAAARAALENSAFDLLVIDYADTDGVPFTAGQVVALKNGPCGRRVVLAYMSIGEAEDYRFYWDPAWATTPPSWLGSVNPDWPGNYKVRFWEPQWQQIIVPPGLPAGNSYVERIQAAGFDGVYLDIIDAFQYWRDLGERPQAAGDMVSFVQKIASYARGVNSGFYVFPQNGADLATQPGYLDLVSGIGAEDTWYNDNNAQDPNQTAWTLPLLRMFGDAGGVVLSIDYVTQSGLIDDFYSTAQAEGFVPYASVRDLDRLTINPGHEPTCPVSTATPTATHPPPSTATPAATGPPPPTATAIPTYTPRPTSTPLPPRDALKKVAYWGYQIQSIEQPGAIDLLAESAYDLLVLEPTRSDRENATFDTAGMVARLHATGGTVLQRKLVLAYIDIGEAEDWRWYWQPDWVPPPAPNPYPDFLLAVDPDGWSGNYPVAFWSPAWRAIMIDGGSGNPRSALDQVVDDGFDGIYMDWVEAYSDPTVAAEALAQGLDPAQEMVDFIRSIGDHARTRNPDFLVVAQNASEISENIASPDDYFAVIDALAQEQIYFDGNADTAWQDKDAGDHPVPETGIGYSRQWYEAQMQNYLDAGFPVFTVDYARQPQNVGYVYSRARLKGYRPYVSLRPLDRLSESPRPGYGGVGITLGLWFWVAGGVAFLMVRGRRFFTQA